MTHTNKRLAIATNAGGTGVMRATEQPVILGMAGRVDPQRTTDFQAVLLAMASHDLRQPLQVIQSSHELLGIGVRTKSEQRLLQRGQHAINRLNGQLDQLPGPFGSMSIQRRRSYRPSRSNRCFGKHAMKMRKARCRRGLTSACTPLARPS
jgi:two-component system, OmpR family, phosphate regulon sensor histidine kinase PhoR